MLPTVRCPRGAASILGISDEFGWIVAHAFQVCRLCYELAGFCDGVRNAVLVLRRFLSILMNLLQRSIHARVTSCAPIVSMCERQSQNSQPHNSHSSLACSLHDVHVARCVHHSSNSVGDGAVQGRGVCVPGETKALSTSTRWGSGALCG